MLNKIKFVSFKSFRESEVSLAPLTFLAGANASGKSNFLDAIRFLQGIGLQMTIADIFRGRWEAGREIWPGIRGGAAEAAFTGNKIFSIESYWSPGNLHHSIVCWTPVEPEVIGEMATTGDGFAYATASPLEEGIEYHSGGIVGASLRGQDEGNVLQETFRSARSILGQIKAIPNLHPSVLETQSQLVEVMGRSTFLDLNPKQMRDYVPKQSRQLGTQGENLSGALFNLCQEENLKLDLVDWLSELCAPVIEDIDFIETEIGDVLLKLVEKGGRSLSVRSLSDGTLRFLGILAALLTAPRDSILLIEEIENGLHPSRIHLLTELLANYTQSRGVQVIATTHSPLLLERLTPEVRQDAILFARVSDKPGTIAVRFGDIPDFDSVLERRGFEYLFTTQWLEHAI